MKTAIVSLSLYGTASEPMKKSLTAETAEIADTRVVRT
jgi:hypothetical protein